MSQDAIVTQKYSLFTMTAKIKGARGKADLAFRIQIMAGREGKHIDSSAKYLCKI
jgi:hypothetical protein